jgi:TonB family protein
MLELKLKSNGHAIPSPAILKHQPRKQAFALVVLLVTFGVLIAKDHSFWFGDDTQVSEGDTDAAAAAQAGSRSLITTVHAAAPSSRKLTKSDVLGQPTEQQPDQQPEDGIVASDRTALPPLDVEVISGDKHTRIHPRSNTTRLEVASAEPTVPAFNAAERAPMSTNVPMPATIPAPEAAVSDTYPLLAPQMKVKGSVILQAVIGADGEIQDLQVLAGPAILSSAARQAVREWRFKPYMVDGHAVETKARITVNFTINVNDSSPRN